MHSNTFESNNWVIIDNTTRSRINKDRKYRGCCNNEKLITPNSTINIQQFQYGSSAMHSAPVLGQKHGFGEMSGNSVTKQQHEPPRKRRKFTNNYSVYNNLHVTQGNGMGGVMYHMPFVEHNNQDTDRVEYADNQSRLNDNDLSDEDDVRIFFNNQAMKINDAYNDESQSVIGIAEISEELFAKFVQIFNDNAAVCFEQKKHNVNNLSHLEIFNDQEFNTLVTQLKETRTEHYKKLSHNIYECVINKNNLLNIKAFNSGKNLLIYFLEKFVQQKKECCDADVTYCIIMFLLDICSRKKHLPYFDKSGKSALTYACDTGKWGIIRSLIRDQRELEKIYTSDKSYTTVLHILCDNKFFDFEELNSIIEEFPTLSDARDSKNCSIAEYAILKDNKDFQQFFKTETSFAQNKNMIFNLCARGDECKEALAELIALYPDRVNFTDRSIGRLPLHYACERGAFELVKILLEKGTYTHVKDNANNTSYDLAKKQMLCYHNLALNNGLKCEEYSNIINSYRKILKHLEFHCKNNALIGKSFKNSMNHDICEPQAISFHMR